MKFTEELFAEAVALTQEQGSVCTALLQNHIKVGYNIAQALIERMVERGIVRVVRNRGYNQHLVN